MLITLKNNSYTDEQIIKCLATCESVISKKAYLEKKWKNCYIHGNLSTGDQYRADRIIWMEYRTKLQSLLTDKYSMREIIQRTKSCKSKGTQKMVKEIASMMD